MTAARRWSLVALGVLATLVLPIAVDAWPADDSDIGAAQLLARVQSSDDVAYSGLAESVGGLGLPTTDEFSEVAELFGGTSRLRVWWRGSDDWRVDRLGQAGETDLFHSGSTTTTWNYEALAASSTADPLVFLPRTVDLLPPRLAAVVLDDAPVDELSRLPTERIAGQDAPGLRLTPAAEQASIAHVDVWAEEDSGLPLRVEVWAKGAASPALVSSFDELTLQSPPAEVTTFTPPPDTLVSSGGLDDDSLVGHIPAVFWSPTLAGLGRNLDNRLAPVARYGQGVTQLLVVALDGEVAYPLRDQLESTAGAVVDDLGTALAAGPLHLRLSPCGGDDPSWLLVGTVDDATLRRAAEQVYGDESTSGVGGP